MERRKRSRPCDSLDITVPIGTPSARVASRQEMSSTPTKNSTAR